MEMKKFRSNFILRVLGIAATSAIFGYSLRVSEENSTKIKDKSIPDVTIESKFINKDNVPDYIITDNLNNEHFVMLSAPAGTYEKCPIIDIKKSPWIYSKNAGGYYGLGPVDFAPHNIPNGNPYNQRNGNFKL